jgi:hypothetical protein
MAAQQNSCSSVSNLRGNYILSSVCITAVEKKEDGEETQEVLLSMFYVVQFKG